MAMKITDQDILKQAVKQYPADQNTHRHAFQAGAEWAISQMQPIPTIERLPTKEDSDNLGCVCAYNAIDQFWIDSPYHTVHEPLKYPYWFSYPPLPEPPSQ